MGSKAVLQVFSEGVRGEGGGTDGRGDGDAEQIDVDDDLRWMEHERVHDCSGCEGVGGNPP